MADDNNSERFNAEIIAWHDGTFGAIKAEMSKLGIKGKTALLKEIKTASAITAMQKRIKEEGTLKKNFKKSSPRMDFGEIFSVGFKFQKHGVWLAKGLGKGRGKSNPKGAKDWFNQVISVRVKELADVLVKIKADAAVNATRLKIN